MDKARWEEQSSGLDWKVILQKRLEKLDLNRLKIYSRTGRPLGTDKFISKVEVVLGRRLRALPVGRPKKENSKVEDKYKVLNR